MKWVLGGARGRCYKQMVAVSRGPRQMEGKLGDASGSGGAKSNWQGVWAVLLSSALSERGSGRCFKLGDATSNVLGGAIRHEMVRGGARGRCCRQTVAVSRGPRQMEGKLGDAGGSGGAKSN